jgi:DNA repair exonuclease SbcCD nuclease subunit
MNLLIYTDLHIKKSELMECALVLDEIIMLSNKYKVDVVYNLGDTFDTLKPESECLDLFSKFITKLNRPLIVLAAQSHESTTPEESIMNHFGILHPSVKVVKEYIDEDYMYCGHFTLTESSISYGATKSAEDYKKYKYVLLGHQHSLQAIGKNVIHLGACRYIDFAESQDKAKTVLLIENYKGTDETNHLLGLKTAYNMVDVYLDPKGEKVPPRASLAKSEEEFKAILDKLPPKTKVRVIFKDFDTYSKVINSLSTYKSKFVLFSEKKDFIISDTASINSKKEISIRESLIKYLEDNKVNEDIKKILLEEIK